MHQYEIQLTCRYTFDKGRNLGTNFGSVWSWFPTEKISSGTPSLAVKFEDSFTSHVSKSN